MNKFGNGTWVVATKSIRGGNGYSLGYDVQVGDLGEVMASSPAPARRGARVYLVRFIAMDGHSYQACSADALDPWRDKEGESNEQVQDRR